MSAHDTTRRAALIGLLSVLGGLALCAGPVGAVPPPQPGVVPASEVSQFSATLNGTLQTGEALVNYHFEYGTSAAYGSMAPIPDAYTPITSKARPVSQAVSGLQAGATYHYRLA